MIESISQVDLEEEGKKIYEAWNRLWNESDSHAWGAGLYFQEHPSCEAADDPYASRGLNPYCYFAFLWYEAFSQIGIEKARALAYGARLYMDYLLLADDFMDGDATFEPLNAFKLHTLHYQALSAFYSAVPPTSPYWSYFEQYHEEYVHAILLERLRHMEIALPCSEEEMILITKGRSAVGKWIPTAMACLAGREEEVEPLESSLDAYYIGLQFMDDIMDWRSDYQRRNFSYLLTRCISDHDLIEAVNSNSPPSASEIGMLIFRSDYIGDSLDRMNEFFDQAIQHVEGIECPAWIARIESDRKTGEAIRNRLKKAMQLKRERREIEQGASTVRSSPAVSQSVVSASEGKPFKEKVEGCIKQALVHLSQAQKMDFEEAQHAEYYIHEVPGYPVDSDVQYGNTFQRALIVDALLDVRQAGRSIALDAINQEIQKLVKLRATDVRGGWRYFPDFKLMPPDADDLGAILQVLVRGQWEDVPSLCEDPISLLMSQASNPDGSFETWLVDQNDDSYAGKWVKAGTERWWGVVGNRGKDPEVTANILYGLYLYDVDRFRERIDQGLSFIEDKQREDGYWSSLWYCGHHYGTYVCSRIISVAKPESPALQKALDFLIRSQNLDGGWSGEDSHREGEKKFQHVAFAQASKESGISLWQGTLSSDPLNTALALQALCWIKKAGHTVPDEILFNGVRYLIEQQLADGSWEKADFIVQSQKPYSSRTLTTAFCLKALLEFNAVDPAFVLSADTPSISKSYCFHSLHEDYLRFLELGAEDESGMRDLLRSTYTRPNDKFLGALRDCLSLDENLVEDALLQMASTFQIPHTTQELRKWSESILRQCRQVVNIPRQMDVCFVVVPPAPAASWGFLQRSRPVIAISVGQWGEASTMENNDETFYDKLAIPIAREYCRALLSLEGFSVSNLLEGLWEEGVAIAFSQEVFPAQSLSKCLGMAPRELRWCEQNKHYLWEGIKPYLRQPAHAVKKSLLGKGPNDQFPEGIWRFLSWKLMANYQERMGPRTWSDLRKTVPEAFLG